MEPILPALGPSIVPPHPARPAQPPRPRARRDAIGPVGQCMLNAIRQNPGIHFRGLARAAGLTSAGQLRHHLDRLGRTGLVVELSDGRYKRFFAAADHQADVRPGMARFSRLIPRRIGEILLEKPLNRTELRRRLGCADSTLGYHLNRMLAHGDVQRERVRDGCQYVLRDPDMVRRVLRSQDEAPRMAEGTNPDGSPATPPPAPQPYDTATIDARAPLSGPY